MAGRISPAKPVARKQAGGQAAQTLQKGRPAAVSPALAAVRARLRAQRAALTPAMRASADASIAGLLDARIQEWLRQGRPARAAPVVSIFWPIGDEPDLRPLMARWAADARLRVALPAIERRAAPLVFRAWTPDSPMRPGDYGIPEPAEGEPLRPDIVLVPTLGFTAEGDRVGYGGGYYDRTLAALRRDGPVLALGVAYACGRLGPDEHLPAPHDARLDAVVSEAGWLPA